MAKASKRTGNRSGRMLKKAARTPEAVLRRIQQGFGLATVTRWLNQALAAMAARGPDAYRLASQRLVAQEQDQRLLAWMRERIDTACPPPRPLKEDLLL